MVHYRRITRFRADITREALNRGDRVVATARNPQTIIDAFGDHPKPPVRLPLGTDTVAKLREKNAAVEKELLDWMDVAVSTDYDDLTGTVSH